jgi:hypothetical protein
MRARAGVGALPTRRSERRAAGLLVGIAAIASAVVTADPASAIDVQARGRDAHTVVVITGDVRVARGDHVDDLFIIDGDARVDGVAEGDVFVINGDVVVTGRVRSDVTSLNGRVILRAGARVGGDVVSKDPARIADTAVVGGEVDSARDRFALGRLGALGRVVLWLAGTVSTFLIGAALLLLAPRAAEAIAAAGRSAPGAVIGVGIALLLGLPLLGILLSITLVGLPIGLALLLALALVYGTGYSVAAIVVGRLMVAPPRNRWWSFLAGWGLLRVLAIVPVLGALVMLAAVVVGLGSIAVAVRRSQRDPTRLAPDPVR